MKTKIIPRFPHHKDTAARLSTFFIGCILSIFITGVTGFKIDTEREYEEIQREIKGLEKEIEELEILVTALERRYFDRQGGF